MNLDDISALGRIIHPSPPILTKVLIDSDTSSSSLRFAQNSYPCSICLSTVRGSKCVQLSCSHIFCRPCLEDFWKLCIEEGDVGRVGCPDPACIKDSREADAEEVARVVTEDDMERWRWLKMKRNLERGKPEGNYLRVRYMVFQIRQLSTAPWNSARRRWQSRREWRKGRDGSAYVHVQHARFPFARCAGGRGGCRTGTGMEH